MNWCPALGTVLANEEVIDGVSERGGHPVVRQPMQQWMLRITAYADRLLEDLEGLQWPESIKEMQRNWIGRSEGATIHFPVRTSLFAKCSMHHAQITTQRRLHWRACAVGGPTRGPQDLMHSIATD